MERVAAKESTSDAVAAVAAGAAALVWTSMWAHQRLAHETTEVNEMRVVWGLTWMDSAKLLPLVALLLVPPTLALRRRAGDSRTAAVGSVIALAALAAFGLGSALHYWVFPRGSYAVAFESLDPLHLNAGIVQALSAPALALGYLLVATPLVRRDARHLLLLGALVLGALLTFFPAPAMLPVAACWLGLPAWLWTTRGETPHAV